MHYSLRSGLQALMNVNTRAEIDAPVETQTVVIKGMAGCFGAGKGKMPTMPMPKKPMVQKPMAKKGDRHLPSILALD